MRYKLTMPSLDSFRAAERVVAAANAEVFVISEKRLSLSVGELSASVKRRIEELGAKVRPEYRFGPDAAQPAELKASG